MAQQQDKTTQQSSSQRSSNTKEKYRMSDLDMEEVMNSYHKNMETIGRVQKASFKVFQNITQLNSQFTREVLDDMREHCKTLADIKTVKERKNVNVEKMKTNITKLLSHGRKVTECWSKTCSDIYKKSS